MRLFPLLKRLDDHYLVPKHEVIPEEKAKELLKNYGTSFEKLPQILRTDPVIEELKAKRGDIIRVVRKSRTAGQSVYYRIVV